MQFFILLLGTMVFVFYQFEPPPVFFNQAAWKRRLEHDPTTGCGLSSGEYGELHAEKQRSRRALARCPDIPATARPRRRRGRGPWPPMTEPGRFAGRGEGGPRIAVPPGRRPPTPTTSSSRSFCGHLPHGLIGLLIAAFFAATLSSKAAELNALASTTTVDFYRHVVRREADDAHYVSASRWFTVMWGVVAVGFRALRQPGGEPDPGGEHRRPRSSTAWCSACSWSRSSCGGCRGPPSSGRRSRPSFLVFALYFAA